MRRESRIPFAALGVIAIPLFCRTAMADMITVIGNLTADGAAVTPKGIAEGWRLYAAA
jgi:hypothetical protein